MRIRQEKIISYKKAVIVVAVSFLFLVAALCLIADRLGIDDREVHDMDDQIVCSVERADGTYGNYPSNTFPPLMKGDKVTAVVNLKREEHVNNAALCFSAYNAVTKVYYKDTLLAEYGADITAAGHEIGHVLFRVAIPEEAWGSSIRIESTAEENYAFSGYTVVKVMPAVLSSQYALLGREGDFAIRFAVLIVFLCLMIYFTVACIFGMCDKQGIFLSVFCCVLSLWSLGYDSMLYVISGNTDFCANAEYFALFAAPAPFCFYMSEIQDIYNSKVLRRIFEITGMVLTGFFIIATMLNQFTKNYHYSRLLPVLHLILCLTILTAIICLITVRSKRRSVQIIVIKYGLLFSMTAMFIELARFNIDKYSLIKFNVANRMFSSLGILLFIMSLLLGYAFKITENSNIRIEREQLREIAYMDSLTGISNRTGCYRYLSELKEKGIYKYTLLFFDVNELKHANDRYGHEMGDRLIMCIANALHCAYDGFGFCGRWGGDEFIACVAGKNSEEISTIIDKFNTDIKRVNTDHSFPFTVSVSYGQINSTDTDPVQPYEAVKLADARMYENKKKYKENRGPDADQESAEYINPEPDRENRGL